MTNEERALVEKLMMLWQPDACANEFISMTDEEQLDLLARLTVLRSAGAVFRPRAEIGERERDDLFARLASLREASASLIFCVRFVEAGAAENASRTRTCGN